MKALRFVRLQGCGNNFIVAQDLQRVFFGSVRDIHKTAAHLQNRHFGVGSDGLMLIAASSEADFEVHMFNPDGSSMGMCGNGIRCVTRFLFLEDLVSKSTSKVEFLVEGRRIICFPSDEGRTVRVDMGRASLDPALIPVNANAEFIERCIPDSEYRGTCVSMGNPHCVIFHDNPEAIKLEQVGPILENHEIFPKRANIEFVKVLSPQRCQVRVWERGAGITLACGTGACAVVVAGHRCGKLSTRAVVELPGGVLEVEHQPDDQRVFLTGPAREIANGEFCVEFLSRIS